MIAMANAKTRKRTPMSDDHKAALARGREEGRAVRLYLEAIEQHRPRRGRQRNQAGMERRLATIQAKLPEADPLSRLHLIQEQADLEAELKRSGTTDLDSLEKDFVKVAKAYSERKGIGYATWRSAGVSAAVLQKAGIMRTGRAPRTAKGGPAGRTKS
jgi:hypothetical protein